MKNPTKIEIEAKTLTVDRIEQVCYRVEEKNKLNLLFLKVEWENKSQ